MGNGYRCVGGDSNRKVWPLFKITEQQDPTQQGRSLVVEGRLVGSWVDELRAYCRCMRDEQRPCRRIDLTGVTFIDADGKLLLSQLWQQGVELQASGCLTRCLLEEITKKGRVGSASQSGNGMTS